MQPSCGNCATPDDALVEVRRVYITPETWDTPGSRQVLEEVERWCISCVSQYPHEMTGDTTGDPR
ncbi:MAG TPA: hypothetical protein VFF40_09595 [Acidimicrobiia bacterium]|nr:hypothetical protein [Acidimicrobiia bacterium]